MNGSKIYLDAINTTIIEFLNKPAVWTIPLYQRTYGWTRSQCEQLWKDIAISEVKKGKKIEGFKVTRINKDSKMALLGLQKGDLIVKVNNIALKSYKAAMDIYAKIDKMTTIQIVVIRNNQEKELIYEIN